jgi:deoxyxylulose-5-phosphate synthase
MSQAENINTKKLANTLEPMIRRVIREELLRVLKKDADIFQLTPEMPLYEDMEEISQRKARDQINLHSHEEVWGE